MNIKDYVVIPSIFYKDIPMKFILRIFIQNIDYGNKLNLNKKNKNNELKELTQNTFTNGYNLDDGTESNQGSKSKGNEKKQIYYNIIEIIQKATAESKQKSDEQDYNNINDDIT